MSTQKMLVNVQEDETRIALTENNLLVDLHIEQTMHERTVGNIYCGTVVKVNPAFQAAFIDYGESRNGFLSASDISPALLKAAKGQRGRTKIQSILKTGQSVMVQVLKEGMRGKGAALTTSTSLPGRYLVLTTDTDRSGVSRKIEDSEKRDRLKEVVSGLMGDDDKGVIIRTAGYDRSPAELKRDLAMLQKEWKKIDGAFKKDKKPRLLYQEPKSLLRVLRDYFSENVQEMWVDSPEAYQEALAYFKAVLPKFQKRLKLYVGDKSLSSAHHIEEQIEALDSSRVSLRSGGSIIIEPTEALVTIDVNSGRSNQASDIEATALQTNLEAAEEVARQLRLRNLGGLIVIDFIDMVPPKNRQQVEKALAQAMANDKARISLGKISEFGLLELSRQRIDVELTRGSRMRCENCGGTGHVPTVNTSANNVLRKIRELAASGAYAEIHGELPLEHANFLLNYRRESLRDLELEFDLHIHLSGNPALPAAHQIRLVGRRPVQETEGEEAELEAAGEEAELEAAGEEAASEEGAAPTRSRRRRRRRGRREAPAEDAPVAVEPVSEQEAPLAADSALEDEETPEFEEEVFAVEEEPSAVEEATEPGNGLGDIAEPLDSFPSAAMEKLEAAPGTARISSHKRGGWLDELNNDTIAAGDTVFQSAHEEPEPSSLPIIQPGFKRSNPFIGVETKDNATLFSSAHREDGETLTGAVEPTAAAGETKAAKGPGTSRSRGRKRAPAKKPAAAGAKSAGRGRAKKT
jgi:ribonuclease E